MPDIRFFHPMEVRYGDLDAQGHLNNAKFLTYWEQGRVRYFEELGLFTHGQSFMDLGVIVADIHIRYRAPVALESSVRVGVRAEKVGGRSITLLQTLSGEQPGQVYAEGTVVLVTYDYHTRKTIAVPEAWRQRIREFEGTENE